MTYQKFRSSHSPAVINDPHRGRNNILSDWQRAIDSEWVSFKINGKPLSEYSKKYNAFKTESDLKTFFQDILLSQFPEEKKKEVLAYLMTSFHQGGLMYPVSSALGACFSEVDPEKQTNSKYGILRDSTLTHEIGIVTTATGFKVQEFCTAGEMLIYSGTSMSHLVTDWDPNLKPDRGHDYIIKAQGVIDIDFSQSSDEPSIGVESNTIDFGHHALKARLDARSFTQILIDFFKNILGLNQVAEITPNSEDPSQENTFRM